MAEEGGQSLKNPTRGGTSLVQMGKMEFCKRDFGRRRICSLERARRGEELGVIVGGRSIVGGGENGGEENGENGLFCGRKKMKMVV